MGLAARRSQVRRVWDAIQQAGEGKGINLLVFGLGHDSAYWNKVRAPALGRGAYESLARAR